MPHLKMLSCTESAANTESVTKPLKKPQDFDQLFYNELIQCLDQLDPRMLQSAGAQWDGMITYANAGGSLQNNDTWSTCDETLRYMEYNCTTQEYGSMPIFEVNHATALYSYTY